MNIRVKKFILWFAATYVSLLLIVFCIGAANGGAISMLQVMWQNPFKLIGLAVPPVIAGLFGSRGRSAHY